MKALRAAIHLLTCLPPARNQAVSPGALVGGMVWFPAVGAVLGAVSGLVEGGVRALGAGDGASCTAAVAAGLLLTGGSHARGLMALTGAMFSGRTRSRVAELAVRRWPTSFGVFAGTMVLLLRYGMLLGIEPTARLWALIFIGGISRSLIVWACWRFPYGDVDTGVAGFLASVAGARDMLLSLPVLAVAFGTLDPLLVAGALAAAWGLSHLFAWWSSQALGGLTATTCEAVAEVGEVGALAGLVGAAELAALVIR